MNREKINYVFKNVSNGIVTSADIDQCNLPPLVIDAWNGSFDAAIKFVKSIKGKWHWMIDADEDGCEVSVYRYLRTRDEEEIDEYASFFNLPPHQALILAAIAAYASMDRRA